MLKDDEICRQINKELAEHGKRLQAEADFLKPYVGALRGRLKGAFPLCVSNQKFMNAVKIDFCHGYNIFIYVDKEHPTEYSWSIEEQYNNGVDNYFIRSKYAEKKYYSIDEILKFLNSVKEWL